MTRNTCVSAFICGSHICRVQPSEFDNISVGPPSRPSTETLSRQPSASIIGIASSPGLSLVERSQQSVDQGLRNALIGHRLEQFCDFLGAKLCCDLRIRDENLTQPLVLGQRLFACG